MTGGYGHRFESCRSVDDAIRTLLLVMPRLIGRALRTPIPEELRSFELAPRHLSLVSYLVFDGPMTVGELAARLEVLPATASLMVSELSRKGILRRMDDDADRRRTIVSIAEEHRPSIDGWLSPGVRAWRTALAPLTDEQRQLFLDTLDTFEREVGGQPRPAGSAGSTGPTASAR